MGVQTHLCPNQIIPCATDCTVQKSRILYTKARRLVIFVRFVYDKENGCRTVCGRGTQALSTKLIFIMKQLPSADFGPETSTPDLLPLHNLQNKQVFHLDETDEIFEGYGRRETAYPYRQRDEYGRKVHDRGVGCAVLENDFLRAEFLTEYGGRLWRLYDKQNGRELLHTNDVLRASNLAVRNAWFAGGVEWNIGVIGHSPLTAEPLFCAELEAPNGEPVLRMYEFERIRGIVYQMDFWLDEHFPALYCAMRITNPAAQVVPMYWWSNMAVPEYEHGRILVPAGEAYTSAGTDVTKVDVPLVNGADVSYYQNIPSQVDYFFNIPKPVPKFIANVDAQGAGLLQASTSRLQSRKLFCWGNNDGSARWQEFLCEHAGRYVEIQAGLGKTQYGCIPMPPHSAWDWLEMYSPVQLSETDLHADFLHASAAMAARIGRHQSVLTDALKYARSFAAAPAMMRQRGSGYASLENAVRREQGLPPLTPHLNFASDDTRQREWRHLLDTGVLEAPAEGAAPGDYMCGPFWLHRVQQAAAQQPDSWYAQYQLGLLYWNEGHFSLARAALERADALQSNAFTLHARAVLALREGDAETAALYMGRGMLLRPSDLGYQKEGMRVLRRAGAWQLICQLCAELPAAIARDPRLRLVLAEALYHTDDSEQAMRILSENGGLEVPDLRENETSINQLWRDVSDALGENLGQPVPHFFNFDAGMAETPSAAAAAQH